ncbi:signal recognition particle 68 kda protein [Anaeramoeba flamelloides]|uniref:Signal recognition particle subunit SRP68 n=1 Tax=Anaeramoeba flamelloides TaxID=1746091 RepID=A0AAV8AG25_9EUKA|nr:signal recognition particle 68 kda protein [Anaeramoeba flamelloides]
MTDLKKETENNDFGAFSTNKLQQKEKEIQIENENENEKEKDPEAEIIENKISFSTLTIIQVSRNENGIKHYDYQRYRHFCSKKLHKLRKQCKMTHGTGKRYVSKPISLDTAKSDRQLLILLFSAERAWAYASELKEAQINPRVKFRMRNRLKKSAKWASQLLNIAQEKCTDRTLLEIQAYADTMLGNSLLEYENFKEALESFLRAKTVFEQLSKVGEFILSEICETQTKEVEIGIRYCTFNISKENKLSKKEIIEMISQNETQGLTLLRSKLDNVVTEMRKNQLESMDEIKWRGESIQISNKAIKLKIISAEELEIENQSELNLTQINPKDSDFKTKLEKQFTSQMSMNGRISNLYNEARELAWNELNPLQSSRNRSKTIVNQIEILSKLHTYLAFKTHELAITRNKYALKYLKSSKGDSDKIVNNYQRLIQQLHELLELELNFKKEREDQEQITNSENREKLINAQIFSNKAFRCFYIANSYLITEKFEEAQLLFERTLEEIQTAIVYFKRCKKSDPNEIENLLELIRNTKSKISFLQGNKLLKYIERNKISQKNKNKNIEKVQENLEEKEFLIDRLEKTFDRKKYATSNRNKTQGMKRVNVVRFPPLLTSVYSKPMLLDNAFNYIVFPNLEEKSKPKKRFWLF